MQRKLRADPSIYPKIPEGMYCYNWMKPWLPNGRPDPEGWYCCPYWDKRKDKPDQESGYCHLMEFGDWEVGTGLLWNQVKECGLKTWRDEKGRLLPRRMDLIDID